MGNRTIKFVARACRWFDRQNGNTYHSVHITRLRDNKILTCPMQYGYDEHYRQTALEAMEKAKWLPPRFRGRDDRGCWLPHFYERESNYPILWTVHDGLKRDCVTNGTP
jgi:hypothetical protein